MEKTELLGVGICGVGQIARRRYIPELLADRRVSKIALCGRDEEKTRCVAAQTNIPIFYAGDDGFSQMLADPEINAVIITTPNNMHYPMAMQAMKCKKHILVEKPLAIHVQQADEILKCAADNHLVCMVAQNRRFLSAYILADNLIKSNLIGKIKNLHAVLRQPGPMEWAPQSSWFLSGKEAGAGVLMDLGIHMADVLAWLLQDEAKWVHCVLQNQNTLYESALCLIEFQEGASACMDVAWGDRIAEKKVVAYGEKGTITIDEYASDAVTVKLHDPVVTTSGFALTSPPLNSCGFSDIGITRAFIDALRCASHDTEDWLWSRHAVDLCEKAWNSAIKC